MKDGKHLYTENYKTLREIKVLNKFYKFRANPVKILLGFFHFWWKLRGKFQNVNGNTKGQQESS